MATYSKRLLSGSTQGKQIKVVPTATTAYATGTITSSGVAITAGDTVVVDGKTYTFKAALTPTEGEVLIGASAAASLDNLKSALNHTGTPDTDYKCAAQHPTVEGTTNTDTVQTLQARTIGTGGNAITLTKVAATLTLSGALLTGGMGSTIVHTAVAGTSDLDELWLWAVNSSTSAVKLTLEWGEVTAPDGNIEGSIPAESGLYMIVPGLLLQNGLVVTAFATIANVVLVAGFVNRITA
jgi:hypothetical protein